MNIYKRGAVYWVKYMVNGIVYRKSTHSRDKRKAKAFADAIRTARNMPTLDEAVEVLRMIYKVERTESRIPLASIWETYEAVAKSIGRDRISESSKLARMRYVRALVAWLGEMRPDAKYAEDVTSPTAAAYAAHLVDLGKKSKTRANIIGELSTVWGILKGASSALVNPWTDLRPAITDSERYRVFTRDEEDAVMAAAAKVGKGWVAACTIARDTGLRYEDIALMLWSEVDMENGELHIKPRKTARHGIKADLPITADMRGVLAALPHDGDHVLPLHAKWYHIRGRRREAALTFREVLDAAGLTDPLYTFHSWRHTAATRMAEAGVSKEVRKSMLGHTTDEMAERYDHDQHMAEKRAAVDAVAAMRGK